MSDKRAKYIILASIIFASIVGISQAQGLFELNDAIPVTPTTSIGYLGHVSAVLKDSDGNIQAYYQTDNAVMARGANCSADLVFNTNFVTGTCFIIEYMALGSSTVAASASQLDLFDKTTNGNELAFLSSVTSAEDGPGVPVDLELRNTFTILAADDGDSIGEAGLFDSSITGSANMFARTLIGPFSMVSEDSLIEVIWTIHIN